MILLCGTKIKLLMTFNVGLESGIDGVLGVHTVSCTVFGAVFIIFIFFEETSPTKIIAQRVIHFSQPIYIYHEQS